jgi:hypothetical protein
VRLRSASQRLVLRFLVPGILAIGAASCAEKTESTSRAAIHDAGKLDPPASDGSRTEVDQPSTDASACSSSGRLVCDASKARAVPWGNVVTVRRGAGAPPAPIEGIVVPGSYQLVSETVYGSQEPNTSGPYVGDQLRKVLDVNCDVFNELDGSVPTNLGSGNTCGRLLARPLTVLEVSGFIVSGVSLPDLRGDASYSATNDSIALTKLVPYWDRARGAIVGSYAVVDHYDLVRGDAKAPVSDEGDAGPAPSIPPPPTRDSRCPYSVPAQGDPCSPDPAPLECEYSVDPLGRCTTFAECALRLDGTFHFQIDVPTCEKPNAQECPPTFATAAALARTSADAGARDAGLCASGACKYPEGVCSCYSCEWTCRTAESLGPACPDPRPLAGDTCGSDVTCEYDAPCGAPSLGPSMICQNGLWAQTGEIWLCPSLPGCGG